MAVTVKNRTELEKMRRAGSIVGACHLMLREAVTPGVTTGEINRLVHEYIVSAGGRPSFLGYPGPVPFPASTCVSVNDEIVHGIPGARVLNDGDIVSVDIGVIWQGFHADSAWSYPVGHLSAEVQRLLDVTEDTLYHALEFAIAGRRLSDISHAIQSCAEEAGFGAVRKYISHGIGRSLHEDPQILNYGLPGRGMKLLPGMTFAIEPMITQFSYASRQLDDGWTVVTLDGGLAAHFEHTIAITANGGPEILTRQE
ncbi:MAG: type I methionyl aminopeptidase [Roseiflexaceae bacterium]|nr:type I methionyl aminopeptidase [Roseiflexaceae bacterium]